MAHSDYSTKVTATGIRKALNLSKSLAINRCTDDMEFPISTWSIRSHTSIAAWDEFYSTLEDIIFLRVFLCLEGRELSSYLVTLSERKLE